MPTNALALSNLRHIQLATEARDAAAPYRTFLDNAHAYRVGGPLLSRTGRPLWFNAPSIGDGQALLAGSHFVSVQAMRVLIGLSREPLIRDHAVPVAVLRDLLLNAHAPSLEVVFAYVSQFYRLGVLTKAEDDKLNAAGLRSRMPAGWTATCDPFARYKAVGIVAQQVREDL